MKRLFIALLSVTACGGGAATTTAGGDTTTIATTTAPEVTTTEAETTTTRDRCADALAESIATFDTLFDRIDADPMAAVDADSQVFEDIGYELGQLLATGCGLEQSGDALSEVLVYWADEATTRPPLTAAVIEGMISGICEDPPVELNLQGRTACALSP